MSYVARNHPQQVAVNGANDEVDDRGTTSEVFDPLMAEFDFTVDAAAAPHNAKCERYWTRADDGLEQDWVGERVWCNPPYSKIEPWVRKAWRSRAEVVVMLLPANRTEQQWWQRWVEPYRDGRVQVRFLAGRIRFIRPGCDEVKPNDRPPYGCCLLIWDRRDRWE